jgi:hypothetical protein
VTYVIRFEAMAGTSVSSPPVHGSFLKSYDVDAKEGFGTAEWTLDPKEALRFEDQIQAFEVWQTQSNVAPWRKHDGKPNRPLTAYTIWVEPAK